jgi:hypothetical protein
MVLSRVMYHVVSAKAGYGVVQWREVLRMETGNGDPSSMEPGVDDRRHSSFTSALDPHLVLADLLGGWKRTMVTRRQGDLK